MFCSSRMVEVPASNWPTSKTCSMSRTISWSPDGQSVAMADLAGELQIRSLILKNTVEDQRQKQQLPEVAFATLPELKLDLQGENIREFLFGSDSSVLLVGTERETLAFSVREGKQLASAYTVSKDDRKWLRHPRSPDTTISCGSRDALLYDWNTMEEKGCVKFDDPSGGAPVTGPETSDKGAPGAGNDPGKTPSLVGAKLCQNSTYLMITTSNTAGGSTGGHRGHLPLSARRLETDHNLGPPLQDTSRYLSPRVCLLGGSPRQEVCLS